jgi:hypothetical protein
VLFVYQLIPRKSGFRESIVFFDTTPISRFLRASFSVHGGIRHESARSEYQLVDMPCIVMPVKFDGGLFMLDLRKKQLFTKKMDDS